MHQARKRTAAALLVVVLALSACGSFDSYAAEVNGQRITQDELRDELKAILDNEEYLDQQDQNFMQNSNGQARARGEGEGTFNSVFVAAVLDRRIGLALIHQEFERRKLEIPRALLDETRDGLVENWGKKVFDAFPRSYREGLVRIFAEQTVLQEALGTGGIDDGAVAAFYAENKEAFEQTCVRHILVATEAEATSVKARLDAGEDFGALATAESTDNQGAEGGSAAKGGDLGCVGLGSFVPEFEAAMITLQPGQVSGPVRSEFGFHLISVTERKSLSLEEAAPQIRANLRQQQPDPLLTYVNEALGEATIKVNPRYGTFEKGPNPGVKAPKLLDPSGPSVPELPQPQAPPGR